MTTLEFRTQKQEFEGPYQFQCIGRAYFDHQDKKMTEVCLNLYQKEHVCGTSLPNCLIFRRQGVVRSHLVCARVCESFEAVLDEKYQSL